MIAGTQKMPRVLLVEDAPFLRYAFGRLLRLQGFDVLEANDGQDRSCVAKFKPQLVLTDLMMPVMGGLELIYKLRDLPETANIPVVAITANATRQAEDQARDAGAVELHHQASQPARTPRSAPQADPRHGVSLTGSISQTVGSSRDPREKAEIERRKAAAERTSPVVFTLLI